MAAIVTTINKLEIFFCFELVGLVNTLTIWLFCPKYVNGLAMFHRINVGQFYWSKFGINLIHFRKFINRFHYNNFNNDKCLHLP